MKWVLALLLLIPSSSFADSQAENTIGGYTASPHIIQSGGTSLSPRAYLDFEGMTCANTGVKTVCTASSGGTPASPSGSIQFNDSGAFGGSANATLDGSGNLVATASVTTNSVATNNLLSPNDWMYSSPGVIGIGDNTSLQHYRWQLNSDGSGNTSSGQTWWDADGNMYWGGYYYGTGSGGISAGAPYLTQNGSIFMPDGTDSGIWMGNPYGGTGISIGANGVQSDSFSSNSTGNNQMLMAGGGSGDDVNFVIPYGSLLVNGSPVGGYIPDTIQASTDHDLTLISGPSSSFDTNVNIYSGTGAGVVTIGANSDNVYIAGNSLNAGSGNFSVDSGGNTYFNNNNAGSDPNYQTLVDMYGNIEMRDGIDNHLLIGDGYGGTTVYMNWYGLQADRIADYTTGANELQMNDGSGNINFVTSGELRLNGTAIGGGGGGGGVLNGSELNIGSVMSGSYHDTSLDGMTPLTATTHFPVVAGSISGQSYWTGSPIYDDSVGTIYNWHGTAITNIDYTTGAMTDLTGGADGVVDIVYTANTFRNVAGIDSTGNVIAGYLGPAGHPNNALYNDGSFFLGNGWLQADTYGNVTLAGGIVFNTDGMRGFIHSNYDELHIEGDGFGVHINNGGGTATLLIAPIEATFTNGSTYASFVSTPAVSAANGGDWETAYYKTVISTDGSAFFAGDAVHIDSSGNTTASSFVKSGGTSSQFLKADGSVDSSTYVTGTVPKIVASANFTGQNATKSPVVTYTTPNDSTSHFYMVGGYVDIGAITAGTITLTVTFKDLSNASKTVTFYQMGSAVSGMTATGGYYFPPVMIRSYWNSAINVVSTFTGTSTTYSTGGTIQSLY